MSQEEPRPLTPDALVRLRELAAAVLVTNDAQAVVALQALCSALGLRGPIGKDGRLVGCELRYLSGDLDEVTAPTPSTSAS